MATGPRRTEKPKPMQHVPEGGLHTKPRIPPLGRQGPGLPGAAQPPEHPSRVLDGWRARPGRDHGEAEGGVDEDKGNGGPSRPGGRVGDESPATRGTKDYHWQPPVAAPIRDTGANTLCHPSPAPGRRGRGHPGPWEDGGRWGMGGGDHGISKKPILVSRAFQRYLHDLGVYSPSTGEANPSTERRRELPQPTGHQQVTR